MVWINLFIKQLISAKIFLQSKNESSRGHGIVSISVLRHCKEAEKGGM